MKNFNNKIVITLFLMIFLLVPASFSQTKQLLMKHKSNYKFRVGKILFLSIKKGCSVFSGKIVEGNGSKKNVSIENQLWKGDFPSNNSEVLELTDKHFPKSLGFYKRLLTKIDIKIKNGDLVGVFQCVKQYDSQPEYFVLVNDKIISSIKNSVSFYANYNQNSETILNIPKLIDNTKDPVFIGFMVESLARSKIKDRNYVVRVLSNLLKNEKIPENIFGLAGTQLFMYLSDEKSFPIDSSVRDVAFKNIIAVARSKNKLNRQAIIILIQIAKENTSRLKPLLKTGDNTMLYKNFQNIPHQMLSQKERVVFGKLLEGL